MKTLLSYVGIKSQETMPVSTADYSNGTGTFSTPPPPSASSSSSSQQQQQQSMGMSSQFMHARVGGGIQNRKFD
jgi:hypothetical protein